MHTLSLSFRDHLDRPEVAVQALGDLYRDGIRAVVIDAAGNDILSACRQAAGAMSGMTLLSPQSPSGSPMPEAAILAIGDAAKLSTALVGYVASPKIRLIACATEHASTHRPLLVVTIPKSGTHLLFRLLDRMGLRRGVELPVAPKAGHYYFVRGQNSHTSARDFFIRDVADRPFGNRHHPFLRVPTIFLYRNPLDILVSEAQYYHRDARTSFCSYLSSLDREDRILRLIDDPWLLGSLRERIGIFIPWLYCRTVLPVSFEELVGSHGGGDDEAQLRAVWSMMLRLHIPGSPAAYCEGLFGGNTDTFREGRIHAHRQQLSATAWDRLEKLPTDFMDALGYAFRSEALFSIHRERFLHRPLYFSGIDPRFVPVELAFDFHGYNIVEFQQRVIAIPLDLGILDLAKDGAMATPGLITGTSLMEVQYLVLHHLHGGVEGEGGSRP